ncbi:MAG: hypothetical protein PHW62_05350 [Candidatus Ratteibacteria bacterium]|nr:hypothetical protein [Candidatus Ratteibacteria bacterium]
MDTIETPIYYPLADDRIRIVVNYNGEWKPIFWFRIAKDKSIYLGPRLKNISELRKGSKQISEGKVEIKYHEGEKVTEETLFNKSKISFHSSGIINFFGDRSYRDSFRDIKQQEELFITLFMHPSKYETIQKSQIKERDVCLNYYFDEEKPLQGLFLISPMQDVRISKIPSAENQLNLVFVYKDLGLVLQSILSHGIKGIWPPMTYILFKTNFGNNI